MKQGIFVWVGFLMLGSVTLSGDPLWAEERHARGLAPDAESTKALDMLEAFPGQAEWDIHWVRAMQGDEKAAARIFVWMRDMEETLVLAKEANVPPERLMKIQSLLGDVYQHGIGTPRDEKARGILVSEERGARLRARAVGAGPPVLGRWRSA
ncbi:MAG: hypothetical protein LBU11_08520 [Zoogloeaceae bacterium]|jgi:hypothetical protein|nr:hypothetical protein [Zoogloeaceae bacterium]